MKRLAASFLLVFVSVVCSAKILRVPQDYPTPQAAVDASVSEDTILIAPGLYKVPARPFLLDNGNTVMVGLALHDGTTLEGSGPAQTVLFFKNALFGIVVQDATVTIKLLQVQNARNMIFAYMGGAMTVKNVIATKQSGALCQKNPSWCSGIIGDQGISYTVYNSVLDKMPYSYPGLGVDFWGTSDLENNIVTGSYWGVNFYYYLPGGASYNDVFHAKVWDWSYCVDNSSCSQMDPLPTNVSFDPLYCPDYTLQTSSRAIHAGNPAILNPDGTRSDMGAYGGPDAIQPPVIATPCVVNFGKVAVGTTAQITMQLFSTTGVDQTLKSFKFAGFPPFNYVGQIPGSILPSGTNLTFSFTPTRKGSSSGKVQVLTPNPFPITILLKGKGF